MLIPNGSIDPNLSPMEAWKVTVAQLAPTYINEDLGGFAIVLGYPVPSDRALISTKSANLGDTLALAAHLAARALADYIKHTNASPQEALMVLNGRIMDQYVSNRREAQ